jgi:hypothetical protein
MATSKKRYPELRIEGADVQWKNFTGAKKRYNDLGNRNFCIWLDYETAARYRAEGWNIKVREARPGKEEEDQAYLEVTVDFSKIPPTVVLIEGEDSVPLDQMSVEILDTIDIQNADIVIRGSYWEMDERSGIKAWLKAGYFTREEEPFGGKYRRRPAVQGGA